MVITEDKVHGLTIYRKKIISPYTDKYEVRPIFECIGKFGTHSTDVFYLRERPEVGKYVWGSCGELHCSRETLSYIEWQQFYVWNYSESMKYWYIQYA